MSKGDNLFGKKTMYKGIEMKSRLESKIAFFLDCLEIKWEYEPKVFMLSLGFIYIPDFYLPELKMWIEVKGIIEEHNKEISRAFVKDNNTELMLISSNETLWFSMKDFLDGLSEDNAVYIGECSSCKHHFFCSNIGIYSCRNCNYHDGDHDLWITINAKEFGNELIDFNDMEDIKRWFGNNGTRI